MTNSTAAARYVTLRCVAWRHERSPHEHELLVEPDGSVLVRDAVAGHYTRCHSLTPQTTARARRDARSSEEIEWDDAWDSRPSCSAR